MVSLVTRIVVKGEMFETGNCSGFDVNDGKWMR